MSRFKLPRLTTDIDCESIGYPGLKLVFWLNPTSPEEKHKKGEDPWENPYWWSRARVIDRILIPAKYTTEGEDLSIEIENPKDVYDLMNEPGFDWNIILWATGVYADQRQERLDTELKNSEAASSDGL